MQELQGRVAVITGAAEGIGKAIAQRAAAEGMRLMLADIDPERLGATVAELSAAGVEVDGRRVDVSRADEVAALADAAWARFGAVHLLVNNAGVALARSAWETSEQDWAWVMGVNLYGVAHSLRAFVPRMLTQGEEGHIVNTASIAGLVSEPALAAYNVSKFGVVTLSEGLHHDLALRKARIGVSVLCPGWVRTRIADAERHRGADERIDPSSLDSVTTRTEQSIRKAVQNGIAPEQVATEVFDAVRRERFYILTHPESRAAIRMRMEDILNDRLPSLVRI